MFILGGKFDKFPQQGNTLAQIGTQTQFGADPKLNFVESSHEQIQIGGDFVKLVTTKHLIDQFVLDNKHRILDANIMNVSFG